MRRCTLLSTVALMLVFAVGTSFAQETKGGRGPGGRGFGMGGPMMLGVPAVQTELGLSEEQVSKVGEVLASGRTKMEGLREQLADTPQEERFAKMRELMAPISSEMLAEAKKILSAEQLARFEQVEIQARGVDAFADEKIHEALKVTAEQKEKITALLEELSQKRRSLMQEAQGDFQSVFGKLREAQTEARTKVMALMNDDQKAAWEKMIGKAFEMPMGAGRRQPN